MKMIWLHISVCFLVIKKLACLFNIILNYLKSSSFKLQFLKL
uniref:Uncharacterized protein n=1 Tax=Anguilla anguilla TaxID=7936 RepID=A0A0E9TMT3_ANGAN